MQLTFNNGTAKGDYLQFLINPNPNGLGEFHLYVWGAEEETICRKHTKFDVRADAEAHAQKLETAIETHAKKAGTEMGIFWVRKAGPNDQLLAELGF